MNKLNNTANGGISLEWDDMRWQDNAVREAFVGLASAFGISAADSFIISGCEVTGPFGAYTMAAGWVWMLGEILPVEAQAVPNPGVGQSLFYDLAITFDPTGNENMFNGGFTQTYEVRKAIPVALTTGSPKMPLYIAFGKNVTDNIFTKIAKNLRSTRTTYIPTAGDFATSPTASQVSAVTSSLIVSKMGDIMNLNFNGILTIGAGVNLITLALPALINIYASGPATIHFGSPIDANVVCFIQGGAILISPKTGNFTPAANVPIDIAFTSISNL